MAVIERELERLTAAVTAGGELQTLEQAIHDRETERNTLRRKIAALEAASRASAFDPQTVERQLRAKLEDWRSLLRRHVPQARQVLRNSSPDTFCSSRSGVAERGDYEFSAPDRLGAHSQWVSVCNYGGVPNGIRTRVLALKGPRPGPLDDGDVRWALPAPN